MNDCVFCKIANGEIPSFKLYEDKDFLVILDRYPAAAGHALVIPKTHAETLMDLDESTAAKLLPLARRTAIKLNKTLSPDGINLLQNNGAAAGQAVPHVHMHVLPRRAGDGVTIQAGSSGPELSELMRLAKILALGD